jgi:tRNA(Leu) C34 or U34 (ribose-2'-O)-methylase TrmL
MAEKENLIYDVSVNTGNSGQSVKGLKAELRELTQQMGTLDQNSAAFQNAAKKAGELQFKMKEVRDAIEQSNPEKKFVPFARAISSATSAFAGLQGAMALFGNENENLQKQMVKLQAAMALSQGLNGILEARNDFAELGNLVKGKVVAAFTTLRGALIATGLGALVVILGTIIANWDKLVGTIEKAFPAFKVVTDFFKNFSQIANGVLESVTEGFKVIGEVVSNIFKGEFSAAIDSAKNFGKRVSVAYNKGYTEEDTKLKKQHDIETRKKELDLLEARGKDVRKKRIELMRDELSLLEKGSKEYNEKLIEIEKARTDLKKDLEEKEKERLKKKKDAINAENISRAEFELNQLRARGIKSLVQFDQAQEAERKLLEEKLKAKQLTQAQYDRELKRMTDERTTYEKDKEKERSDSIKQANLEKLQNEIDTNKEIFNDQTLSIDERIKALEYLHSKGISLDVDANKFKQDLRIKDLENQRMVINEIGNTLNNLGLALGANAEQQKALAIATTTIDTIVATQTAFMQAQKNPISIIGPVYPYIMAAGALAAGMARVRAIVATPTNGGGGGGMQVPASPSVPSAPALNPASSSVRLQGANEPLVTRSIRTENQRVYVLESDITDTQERVNMIKQKARVR